LADLWGQLREGLGALARAGFTHGDLSAYNVLVYQGQLVLIDLPQVVDVVVNPRGRELMERDVRNIGTWFAARGLRDAEGEMREMVDYVGGEAGLGWRSEEGGGDGEGGEDAGAGAGAEEKVMGGEGV
jgi:RIO kinase 1